MDLFRTRSLPYLSRRNYQLEVQLLLLWGVFAGMIEGNVCAVIAAKTFAGSDLLVTVIAATPMIANLVSLAWGVISQGRRKQVMLLWLAASALLSAASIGLTPQSDWGGWLFAAQIGLARIFVSGVVTVRTNLWKLNYPGTVRGMVTGRLQLARAGVGVLAVAAAGVIYDHDARAYHWLFPAAAAVGLAGVWVQARMHVRGERAALRARRAALAADAAEANSGDAEASSARIAPFDLVAQLSPLYMVREMVRVLRRDRLFARYCGAQMSLGAANIMLQPILPLIFTRRLDLSYFAASGMLDLLPNLVLLVSLGMWGRLFDRVGVIRMRVVNTLVWVAAIGLSTAAAFLIHGDGTLSVAAIYAGMIVFVLARLLYGVAISGGAIAWHIGHLQFAGPHDDELYMGIHVSLTGIRGLIAPFVGLWLYRWLDWGVFVAALLLVMSSVYQFALLARDMPRGKSAAAGG